MPPLGIAYLSGYLKKYGYKVSIFDLNIHLCQSVNKDLEYLWDQKSYNYWVEDNLFNNQWARLKETVNSCIVEVLKNKNVKYIGLSVNFAGIKFASELIKIIKALKSEIKIILGGWGCINDHMRSLFPKELVDVFVIGEGEETLIEVLDALDGRKKKLKFWGLFLTEKLICRIKPGPQ